MEWIIISCPYLSDNIRKCTEFFGNVVEIEKIETCQSNRNWKDCIFYKMLNFPKEKQCKFTYTCSRVAEKTIFNLPLDEIKKLCNKYCLSENQEECAIYKHIDSLTVVPEGLLPDGRIIKINE